jgi:hypothetical protein
MKRRTVIGALAIAVEAGGIVDRLGRTWGSTPDERRRALPSDALLPFRHIQTDHAVTIAVSPDDVWPWLVQMGWGRAGWYTYRWVDRLFFPHNGPSSDVILPEFQTLSRGDHVPDGAPETGCHFVVEAVEPPRTLVLRSTTHLPPKVRGASMDWVWTYTLDPVADGTRLHLRSRLVLEPRRLRWLFRAGLGADFVMSRSHLRGIKARAEAARSSRIAARAMEAAHA